ncbi:4829_t:CDS:1, partial [Racocetra persica]
FKIYSDQHMNSNAQQHFERKLEQIYILGIRLLKARNNVISAPNGMPMDKMLDMLHEKECQNNLKFFYKKIKNIKSRYVISPYKKGGPGVM